MKFKSLHHKKTLAKRSLEYLNELGICPASLRYTLLGIVDEYQTHSQIAIDFILDMVPEYLQKYFAVDGHVVAYNMTSDKKKGLENTIAIQLGEAPRVEFFYDYVEGQLYWRKLSAEIDNSERIGVIVGLNAIAKPWTS